MNLRNMIIKIHICLIAFCFISGIKAQTQNSMTEIIPFKTIDGKIIIEANINGETANFVLDLAGHNALLPEAVNQLKINTKNASSFGSYQNFKFKQVPVKKIYEIGTLTIGNNTSVSYTHLRAHETGRNLVCRLLLEKKKKKNQK